MAFWVVTINFVHKLNHCARQPRDVGRMGRLRNIYRYLPRRNARIASAVLAIAILSVCPGLTRRYCVKTTAPSTVQFALFYSKIYLVL